MVHMEQTRKKNILYWLAKIFISIFIAFSAYYSYSHAEDLAKLGFPAYFRKELVTAKIIGAIALLLPITPARVKEWIYAGFIIAMVSALVAHVSSGDPVSRIIFVSVDLILILLSMRYVSNIDLLKNRI
jgi:putative oxidoreductase